MTGDDRLEEARLRRALRLEADELPPRLDPVLIAAAARTTRAGSDVLPIAALAFAAGWIVSEMWRVALAALPALLGEDAFGIAIDAVTAAAVVLGQAAAVAVSAAVPLTAAAAVLMLIAFGQRRERA